MNYSKKINRLMVLIVAYCKKEWSFDLSYGEEEKKIILGASDLFAKEVWLSVKENIKTLNSYEPPSGYNIFLYFDIFCLYAKRAKRKEWPHVKDCEVCGRCSGGFGDILKGAEDLVNTEKRERFYSDNQGDCAFFHCNFCAYGKKMGRCYDSGSFKAKFVEERGYFWAIFFPPGWVLKKMERIERCGGLGWPPLHLKKLPKKKEERDDVFFKYLKKEERKERRKKRRKERKNEGKNEVEVKARYELFRKHK